MVMYALYGVLPPPGQSSAGGEGEDVMVQATCSQQKVTRIAVQSGPCGVKGRAAAHTEWPGLAHSGQRAEPCAE